MDFSFFTEADQAGFNLEKAKRALDGAKAALETAKSAFDDVMARADDHGVPRAKLKKVIEERVQALFDSGLVGADGAPAERSASASPSAGAAKQKRNKKTPEIPTPESESVLDEAMADSDVDDLPQA